MKIHVKIGVHLAIEMRLAFGIFVKLTVRHVYAYAVHTKSHMQVSPELVKSKFLTQWLTVSGTTYHRGNTVRTSGGPWT